MVLSSRCGHSEGGLGREHDWYLVCGAPYGLCLGSPLGMNCCCSARAALGKQMRSCYDGQGLAALIMRTAVPGPSRSE